MKRFSILIVLLAIFNLLQAQEKYPGFPSGGMPACMEFIEANLNYSLLDSVLDNIEGKVVVVTQLDTLGNIFSAQVKKRLHPPTGRRSSSGCQSHAPMENVPDKRGYFKYPS